MRIALLIILLLDTGPACGAELTAAGLAARFKAHDESVIKDVEAAGAAAVPVLVHLLDDPAPEVAGVAAGCLGTLGEVAGAAAAPLGRKLKHPDERMRQTACSALSRLKGKAAPAVQDLDAALEDSNEHVRQLACELLGNLKAGFAVPHIVRMLERPGQQDRQAALYGLRAMGPAAEGALPELIKALADKQDHMVNLAAETLGFLGAKAVTALPALQTAALQNGMGGHGALFALGRITAAGAPRPSAPGALEVDGHGLEHWLEREHDKQVDKKIVGLGAAAGPPLVELTAASSVLTRLSATKLLRQLEPTPTISAAFLRLLDDPAAAIREEALGAVSNSPRPDPGLVSVLLDRLRKGKTDAESALMNPVLPARDALLAELKDKSSTLRHRMVVILQQRRELANALTVPQLAALLHSTDGRVRYSALEALTSKGPDAAAAAPRVVDLLRAADNRDERVRGIQCLTRLGPLSPDARTVLEGFLKTDQNAALQFVVKNALR